MNQRAVIVLSGDVPLPQQTPGIGPDPGHYQILTRVIR